MKEEEKRNDKKGSLFPSLISMEENKMVETVSLGPWICNPPNLGGFEGRQWFKKKFRVHLSKFLCIFHIYMGIKKIKI